MTILQSLDRYYERMAARGDVTPAGWSIEPVGVVIVLDHDGNVSDVFDRLDPKGKRGLPARVPKWFGRAGQGSTPFLFWDNTAYALGVSTKDAGKTQRDHEAFKALHARELANETDEGLVALRLFLERWSPNQFVGPRFNDKMLAFNVAFRLDGFGSELLHQRPAAVAVADRLRASASATVTAFCLVRGARLPVVRLHPKIKGVNGTASPEVPLVSFNEPSFASYGKEQGYNAPTSEEAAGRYTAALTALLNRDTSRNRLARGIGDATVVFWADTSETVDEAAAEAAETWFADLNEPPEDESEAKKVRDGLDRIVAGEPVAALDPRLAPGTRFHVLGLAPNAARLSVRYWLTDDFGAFVRRLAEHHRDLAIEPPPWGERTPSIAWLLARSTTRQKNASNADKLKNIPPLLAGEVMRSVLAGTRYPRTLLAAAITRLRAGDDPGSGWHAAVIKAVINRSDREEEISVALNPDSDNPAYQLGRLFALLEAAQYAALGRVNAPISDRYYGAASATPARVFAPLLRGLRNHLSDARKRGRGGWIEPRIVEVIKRLPENIPRTLRLEDQGRFAVGYYHERATRQAKEPDTNESEGDADGR